MLIDLRDALGMVQKFEAPAKPKGLRGEKFEAVGEQPAGGAVDRHAASGKPKILYD